MNKACNANECPEGVTMLTYIASLITSGLEFISCLFELASLSAVNLSDIISLKSEAYIPVPSNHQATVGSIFVWDWFTGSVKQLSLPASDWETGITTTTWSGQHQIRRQAENRCSYSEQQRQWETKSPCKDASLFCWLYQNIWKKYNSPDMKCNESSKAICLSKICSAFQTACTHVTVVRSASGTHKAQEIKAVNKRSVR